MDWQRNEWIKCWSEKRKKRRDWGVFWPMSAAAAAKSLQLCLILCDPIDSSPPGSSVPRILQAITLELGCHFLLQCMKVKSESEVAQSCPTLSDPMDCSLPGSSIHGIFQARILKWGAIAFCFFRICAVLARVQKIVQPVYYTLKDFLCVLCFG